jgi:integrase
MDARRRRGTGRHAGVVLSGRTLPSGAFAWRARYTDPDSGKKKWETLPASLTTEEQRVTWATEKARLLRERDAVLATGGPRKKHMTLEAAFERYFETASNRLKKSTQQAYRDAVANVLSWARDRKIGLSDDLRGEHLAELHAFLVNKPLQRQLKGETRHRAHVLTRRVRKPRSVNRELRAIKTILEQLRRLGLVPLITRDAIFDNLKLLREGRPIPEFLKSTALAKLIEAARRHDTDTFAMTRAEKARGEGHAILRYPPILPFLTYVLLTGMRATEARLTKWSAVDLTARPAGNITLRPEDVKTSHGRIVDLVVSNLLGELLARMQLKSGGKAYVFGGAEPITHEFIDAARKRLLRNYGAPTFSWQMLRATCGTFLANAPGIFGGASAYREARQLGHSVTVAERHYLGVVHVDPMAKTLEAAMEIEDVLRGALGFAAATVSKRAREK